MFQKNDLVETRDGLGVVKRIYHGGLSEVELLETGKHIFWDNLTLLKIPDDSF